MKKNNMSTIENKQVELLVWNCRRKSMGNFMRFFSLDSKIIFSSNIFRQFFLRRSITHVANNQSEVIEMFEWDLFDFEEREENSIFFSKKLFQEILEEL